MEKYITIREVKTYIDNNLNSTKVNVIDPTKDNITRSLGVKEILDELQISKDDYYRALSISKDEDLKLYLKKEPNLINIYKLKQNNNLINALLINILKSVSKF